MTVCHDERKGEYYQQLNTRRCYFLGGKAAEILPALLDVVKMAAHELDVFSLTNIDEIQRAYAQIHLHEVFENIGKRVCDTYRIVVYVSFDFV